MWKVFFFCCFRLEMRSFDWKYLMRKWWHRVFKWITLKINFLFLSVPLHWNRKNLNFFMLLWRFREITKKNLPFFPKRLILIIFAYCFISDWNRSIHQFHTFSDFESNSFRYIDLCRTNWWLCRLVACEKHMTPLHSLWAALV